MMYTKETFNTPDKKGNLPVLTEEDEISFTIRGEVLSGRHRDSYIQFGANNSAPFDAYGMKPKDRDLFAEQIYGYPTRKTESKGYWTEITENVSKKQRNEAFSKLLRILMDEEEFTKKFKEYKGITKEKEEAMALAIKDNKEAQDVIAFFKEDGTAFADNRDAVVKLFSALTSVDIEYYI